jgi:hypothetical protein
MFFSIADLCGEMPGSAAWFLQAIASSRHFAGVNMPSRKDEIAPAIPQHLLATLFTPENYDSV